LGDSGVVEQIKKQLNKLINVIKVLDFTGTAFVQREMALVKVRAKPEHRAEILRMVDIFRSKVVDVGTEFYTIEVTGAEDKIEAFLKPPQTHGNQGDRADGGHCPGTRKAKTGGIQWQGLILAA
jgi:acetolactate synthase small subunit